MRKSFGMVGLFLACSAFSFWLTIPKSTNAAVFAVAAFGCYSSPTEWDCTLPQGTTVPIAALSGVYFDFYARSGDNVQLSIYKHSYSGSSYIDYATVTGTGGNRDDYVVANNVKTNGSQWDYLSTQFFDNSGGGHTLQAYGVGMVNTQ